MPIYEYRCANGHAFEAFQSMSEEAIGVCRVCGAAAERVLSPVAIHFKGSGFYTTDYARKGASASSNGSDPAKKAEGKGESKGESGASKSEGKTSSTSD